MNPTLIESPCVSDEQVPSIVLSYLYHVSGIGQCVRDWFFTNDVFAVLQGFDGKVRMFISGRTNINNIDIVVF